MVKSNPWEIIGNSSGLLTDEDIEYLGSNGLLITKNYEKYQVHQTCYELRVGEVAYFLLREEINRKIEVDVNNPIIMRPGDVVTIITYEEVQLPDNLLGRIISKGHLFSIGLSPVITFVDPGFSGKLGITFINHSKRSVKFRYKESICKIEFEKLGKKVKNPYRGQHNFASEIWPLDYSKFTSKRKLESKEIRNNTFLKDEAKFFGEPFDLIVEVIIDLKNNINKIYNVLTSVILGVFTYVLLSIMLNMYEILPGNIKVELVSGIISILFMIIKYMIEKFFKKL